MLLKGVSWPVFYLTRGEILILFLSVSSTDIESQNCRTTESE